MPSWSGRCTRALPTPHRSMKLLSFSEHVAVGWCHFKACSYLLIRELHLAGSNRPLRKNAAQPYLPAPWLRLDATKRSNPNPRVVIFLCSGSRRISRSSA